MAGRSSFDLIEKNTSALSLFTCSRPELEKIGLISTSSIPIHKNKINGPSDPIKLFLIRNLFNQSLQLQRNLNNVPKEDQQLRSLEARINSNLNHYPHELSCDEPYTEENNLYAKIFHHHMQ
jgi:hypothetical protein